MPSATDPINFACNILGVKPWDKQQQILDAIALTTDTSPSGLATAQVKLSPLP